VETREASDERAVSAISAHRGRLCLVGLRRRDYGPVSDPIANRPQVLIMNMFAAATFT
jgi:hypothetical protein